jgi:hypothetical protein
MLLGRAFATGEDGEASAEDLPGALSRGMGGCGDSRLAGEPSLVRAAPELAAISADESAAQRTHCFVFFGNARSSKRPSD